MNDMDDIERELESELQRVLDPISRLPIPPRHAPSRASYVRGLLGGAGGAFTIKVLTGVMAVAAAATVATAASTGALDPGQVSQGISEKVEACKADLQSGQHGIGQCVSGVAQHHGEDHSTNNGGGNGAGNGQSQGNGSSQQHGNGNGPATTPPGQAKDKDKPTPPGRASPRAGR